MVTHQGFLDSEARRSRRLRRVNPIMLLLQNWTDALEMRSARRIGEKGATLGRIQSIRLHGPEGGAGKRLTMATLFISQ